MSWWKLLGDVLWFAFWAWVWFRVGRWYGRGLTVEQYQAEVEKLQALFIRTGSRGDSSNG